MFKNIFSKGGLWTTLSALVGLVLMALVLFGVISGEEKDSLKSAWDSLVLAIPGGDATIIISTVVVVIQQIVLLFVKDPVKEQPKNKGSTK